MFNSLSTYAILLAAGTVVMQMAAWLAMSRALLGTTFSPRHKTTLRTGFAAVLIVWFGTVYALATAGFYSEATVLKQVISLLIPFSIGIALMLRSQTMRDILAALPQTWMIGIHTLRVIGVVFLMLGAMRVLPPNFALLAGYGDITAGLLAPIVAIWFASRRAGGRALAMGWNVFGVLDFGVAAAGLFAVSAYFRANPAPAIQASLTTLLVIAVPILLLLHVFSLRGLIAEGRASTRGGQSAAVRAS